jgi:hypothetical protein
MAALFVFCGTQAIRQNVTVCYSLLHESSGVTFAKPASEEASEGFCYNVTVVTAKFQLYIAGLMGIHKKSVA